MQVIVEVLSKFELGSDIALCSFRKEFETDGRSPSAHGYRYEIIPDVDVVRREGVYVHGSAIEGGVKPTGKVDPEVIRTQGRYIPYSSFVIREFRRLMTDEEKSWT